VDKVHFTSQCYMFWVHLYSLWFLFLERTLTLLVSKCEVRGFFDFQCIKQSINVIYK
jgi:hypothetical protein